MIHQAKILQRLGLSEEQKRAVRKIMDTERETLTRQITALAEQHRELELAIGSGASEATLREKASGLGQLYGEISVMRAGLRQQFNEILTDEQKRQAAELSAEDDKQDEAERLAQEAALKARLAQLGGAAPRS